MTHRDHPIIEAVDLCLPDLPPALEGLTIAHVTDLHIRRPRPRFRRVAAALDHLRPDLYLLTGDYMTYRGDEPHSVEIMGDLTARLKPNVATFGVFGNHDSKPLPDALAAMPVRWLKNQATRLPDLPIEILGFHSIKKAEQPDSIATLGDLATPDPPNCENIPLRVLLSHYPSFLPIAADLGVHLMLSGHTHGGQWRLPWRKALYNSCDLPLHLSAGILRHRDTLCALSRGLGETLIEFRLFCPPQLPVYTLRNGPLPGQPTHHIENVQAW